MFHKVNLSSTQSHKVAWATDLHLDASELTGYNQFVNIVREHQPDILLIGGDISNGAQSLDHLQEMVHSVNIPIYFVLGNHDYYFGSIPKIREEAGKLSRVNSYLNFLTAGGIFELAPEVGLVGHDGWSDGRCGNFLKSDIQLNDYFLIHELREIPNHERLLRLHKLGDEAAAVIRTSLPKALDKFKTVIVLTHSPPFRETCLYEGKITNDNWAPHFVCKAMGKALREIAEKHKDNEILVLCGHSHNGADVKILPNLRVLTGQSELGFPRVQGMISLSK